MGAPFWGDPRHVGVDDVAGGVVLVIPTSPFERQGECGSDAIGELLTAAVVCCGCCCCVCCCCNGNPGTGNIKFIGMPTCGGGTRVEASPLVTEGTTADGTERDAAS